MRYICYKVIQESKDGKRLVTVPSENVAEVVRCGECKYYNPIYDIYGNCELTEWRRRTQNPDDFCSRGERRE